MLTNVDAAYHGTCGEGVCPAKYGGIGTSCSEASSMLTAARCTELEMLLLI